MKKIAVLTSGGDAPGMNAATRSVIRCAIHSGMEVYAIQRGYEGLLDDEIELAEWKDTGDIIYRGGTILRTARCMRFHEDKWVDKGVENLKKRGIEGLVVIGGDGSYRGSLKIAQRGIKVVGIPATIDNDLAYTDFTLGFNTALETIIDLIAKVRDTSSSHERNTIIEIMGRNCGDLTLFAGICSGADAILIPEVPVNLQNVVDRIRSGNENGKLHNVILKAEGVDMPLKELEQLLETLTGRETRSVVPGYIQRGGSPSAQDRLFASMAGAEAIRLLDKEPFWPECNAYAIGSKGDDVEAVALVEALNAPRRFRYDLLELNNILG